MARQTILQQAQSTITHNKGLIADQQARVICLIDQGNYNAAMNQAEALGAMHLSLNEDLRSFNVLKILVENRHLAGSGH